MAGTIIVWISLSRSVSAVGVKAFRRLRWLGVGVPNPRASRICLLSMLCGRRWPTAAAAALAVCSSVSHATADGPDHFSVRGIAAGDALNIRAEPNPKAAKLGAIPPGASCIRNLGCQGGLSYQEFSTLSKEQQQQRLRDNPRWCRIEWRGITGWVAGRYLAEEDCPR